MHRLCTIHCWMSQWNNFDKRLSYCRWTMQHAVCWNLVTAEQLNKKSHLKRLANRWMTLKGAQGHQNWYHFISVSVVTMSLSCTICEISPQVHNYSARDCLWPREILLFRQDSWNYKPCLLSDLCVNTSFPEVRELEIFQTTKVTFKVTWLNDTIPLISTWDQCYGVTQ